MDNSDYKKPRTKLHNLLPDVYSSHTNTSVFENLFNRFFTKQDTVNVAGYIGAGNPNAITKRQITEPTLHRQAFQLQPIVRSKIGTIEHMASWKDIEGELARLGVDVDRLDQWGVVQQFNWVPPIDIDKLVHYRDYFWHDPDDSGSTPQYITMRSRCATAVANYNFWQTIISSYGDIIPIENILPIEASPLQFPIVEINSVSNYIKVKGNVSNVVSVGDSFNVITTLANNDNYTILTDPTYDIYTNESTVQITGDFVSDETDIGIFEFKQYDKLLIDGDYGNLLESGFVFFFKNSTNAQLNEAFWSVAGSTYDETTTKTTIQLDTVFSNIESDGNISLQEQNELYIIERDCQCSGSVGWDVFQWDDSPDNPLWNGDHSSWLATVSNTVPPVSAGTIGQTWFDTVSDILYQYTVDDVWKVIFNNFSKIIKKTQGLALWDLSSSCNTSSRIKAADQWISQNKWLHKNDLKDFSIAQPARYPIIEFDWDLELNEWTFVAQNWKYRKDKFTAWGEPSISSPNRLEVALLDLWEYDNGNDEIILDERYGDLTDVFIQGYQFRADGTAEIYNVVSSRYVAENVGEVLRTKIQIDVSVPTTFLVSGELTPTPTGSPLTIVPVVSTTPIIPHITSQGDPWIAHNNHWLYVGADEGVSSAHVPQNIFSLTTADIGVEDPSGDYIIRVGTYEQEYQLHTSGLTTFMLSTDTLLQAGMSRSLRRKSLKGFDDIQVYVNGIRTYGTYDEIGELDNDGVEWVSGITFIPGEELNRLDQLVIHVGESSMLDLGFYSIPVRMEEDDVKFALAGTVNVSIVSFKKNEQVKSMVSQYPLFDLYDTKGDPVHQANGIFGFKTDSNESVNPAIGQRIVVDATTTDYTFDQFLIDQTDGELLAYRDYSNSDAAYWFNIENGKLLFWEGLTWSEKTLMGNVYTSAHVGNTQPSVDKLTIDGFIWYDTINKVVKSRNTATNTWDELATLNLTYDQTLQTIWRGGLAQEEYIPEQVDWDVRNEEMYNEVRDIFIKETADELFFDTTTLTREEAEEQSTTEWYESQVNPHSVTGQWQGDWEIPDPMYFNNLHENRKYVTSRELLTHFDSIISAQPKIPGFVGPKSSMFHNIATGNVNYGIGGKIKEYNDGFDTFISAIFANNVTPVTLVDYAVSQYQSLLNNIKEILRSKSVDFFTTIADETIIDFSSFISDEVIKYHELNDSFSLVFGDSNTFTEGDPDLGIRNWVATLPYVLLKHATIPQRLQDLIGEVDYIKHHDGHIAKYKIDSELVEKIIQDIVTTSDPRTRFPDPSDPPVDTFGKESTQLPPNTVNEFEAQFNTTIENREGVYWYHNTGTIKQLYKLTLINIGTVEPSSQLPDGTLWMDMALGGETLLQKSTVGNVVVWNVVDGLAVGDGRLHNGSDSNDITTSTVAGWQKIDFSDLLMDTVLAVELKLYENAPTITTLAYDVNETKEQYPALFELYSEPEFLDYMLSNDQETPYVNSTYDAQDPFTWNYKYSTPGFRSSVVSADSSTDSFTILGDYTAVFDQCATNGLCPSTIVLYVTGSSANDGTWNTISSTLATPSAIYDVGNDTTTIYVDGMVVDSNIGTLYVGALPSSANDGSESGGDWKDLYQKLYGTSFPHLEPWTLQGYTEKPSWWDEEYLNSKTPTSRWGTTRTWKYMHGFDIVTVDDVGGSFGVDHDFTDIFSGGTSFGIDSSNDHEGTYTVISSTYDSGLNVTTITVLEPVLSSNVEGRIAKSVGMWNNIRWGTVPAGRDYPNGVTSASGNPETDILLGLLAPVIPTYGYFSVNIDNVSVSTDGGNTVYAPDSVFPPYWDFTKVYTSVPLLFDTLNRSIYFNFSAEIISPATNYVFGDIGPNEWEWRHSAQSQYDDLNVAFRIDPVRTVSDTFGFDYDIINNLQIDSRTKRTSSHTRTIFHGESLNGDINKVDGLNQWYVNFNRSFGYDTNFSDFRALWTQWKAPLTYQLTSFIDTPSLEIDHRQVVLTNYDYTVTSKKSSGIADYWLDAFKISLITLPPKLARYDNQADWELLIDTNLPISRNIKYYDVHNYQFRADKLTNVCTIYSHIIIGSDDFANTFSIQGDQTDVIKINMSFNVAGSTYNDGTYIVDSVAYDAVADATIIIVTSVAQNVIGNDGVLTLNYRTLPWETGDRIITTSHEMLPVPFETEKEYFVIKISDIEFKLALTLVDANNGNAITMVSNGARNHYIGQINNTFIVGDGTKVPQAWKHYKPDTSTVLSLDTPSSLKGLQNLINFVHGYEQYQNDQGWGFNESKEFRDPFVTSRPVSWQLELERFIAFAFTVRIDSREMPDRFISTVDQTTDIWTFSSAQPQFITGEPVSVYSSNNVVPQPLAIGLVYYMIRDSIGTFRLASTKQNAELGTAIDITSIVNIGTLSVANARLLREHRPTFELNPFRNGVWFHPDRGIISNVLKGPSDDVKTSQLIFDQYGRPLTEKELRVYREDTVTQLTLIDEVRNDVELLLNPYSFLHLGGLHIFIDTYEHAIVFNNTTTEGNLLYDPFIGLNVTKYELLFNKQKDFTQRPNVGGYYLHTENNQGAELKRNIEAGVEDLRYLYDTFLVSESDELTRQGRKTIGYDGTKDYLDNLNINKKSQFLFWKGQIQHKGSTNVIKAIINSRRFIDAKVDEYWAVKIAEFGSAFEKEYPEMWLTAVDARTNDLRLHFIRDPEVAEDGFVAVEVADSDRWVNAPDQLSTLRNNGQTIFFELAVNNKLPITTTTGEAFGSPSSLPSDPVDGQGVINEDSGVSIFYIWNEVINQWEQHESWTSVGSPVTLPKIRHNFKADLVELIMQTHMYGTTDPMISGIIGDTITIGDYITGTGNIKVFKNGVELISGVDYIEEVLTTLYSNDLMFTVDLEVLDEIEVLYDVASLVEGIHFRNINANIVELLYNELTANTIQGLTIWGSIIDKESQNPINILDKESHTLVAPVQIWDPARDINYHISMQSVDLQSEIDPAIYFNTPVDPEPFIEVLDDTVDPQAPSSLPPRIQLYNDPWNNKEVGITWWNTYGLSYKPYYDTNVYGKEDQLRLWGSLSEYSSVEICEWVKSDVPPEEWDELALVEEGDTSIDVSVRKSGTAKKTLFKPSGSPSEWKVYRDRFDHQDVIIDGVSLGSGTYRFVMKEFVMNDVVSIYKNGSLWLENQVVEVGNVIDVVELVEYDHITFVNFAPIDLTVIQAGVDAGTLKYEYQYTAEPYFDEIGLSQTWYYFWVVDKKTKTRDHLVSPKLTSERLTTIPVSYAIFRSLETPTVNVLTSGQELTRTWSHVANVGQTTYTLGVPVKENDVANLSVTVNNVSAVVVLSSTGKEFTITSPVVVENDDISATYITLYDDNVDMPFRFTQVVVRGLRGIVDQDNRYALQYMRDFTLRDELYERSTPLSLKNKHEEWELFREAQTYHIKRELWDKITESMLGYKLDDMTVRVPQLDRELYDIKNESSTRYGIGEGQQFTDGSLAIQTVLVDLNNSDNNFYPVDINVFLDNNNFDTPENIIATMDGLYNSFAFEHVNRIFFSVLHDALTFQNQYKDIIKTSMVALHGIRPFQNNGVFDT